MYFFWPTVFLLFAERSGLNWKTMVGDACYKKYSGSFFVKTKAWPLRLPEKESGSIDIKMVALVIYLCIICACVCVCGENVFIWKDPKSKSQHRNICILESVRGKEKKKGKKKKKELSFKTLDFLALLEHLALCQSLRSVCWSVSTVITWNLKLEPNPQTSVLLN